MAFIKPSQVPPLPFAFLTWGETPEGKLELVKGHLTKLAAKRAYLKLSRTRHDLKSLGWATIEPGHREYGMNP